MIETDTLIAGVPLASLIVVIVGIIRRLTDDYITWDGEPAVALTLAVGPLFALLAWWLGYLPRWAEWRDAARAGVEASFAAAGLFSMVKPIIRKAKR